jgi:hypothetical protein
MIPDGWTPETLTARQLVAYPHISASFNCLGCRVWTDFNIWKVGARSADEPLQTLRFRCQRCGVYPKELKISRRTSGLPIDLMIVPLKPRCWDEGHEAEQRRCLARAEARRKAAADAYRRSQGG